MPRGTKETVIAFWSAMQTNDFSAASMLLTEDFELYWPQSSERIIGRANFAALNTHYPAHGPWRFTVDRILAEGNEVVTEVSVTDGEVKATALTFSTVKNGLIARQVEYWPDPFEAPAWRREWVQINIGPNT